MTRTVYCVVNTEERAKEVIETLKRSGLPNDSISVLLSDKRQLKNPVHEHSKTVPEGASSGAGTGALVGGALGGLAGFAALAVPGIGPILIAGPIAMAIGGAAVGTALGQLLGGMTEIPEEEVQQFAGKIKEGNIVILVQSSHPKELDKARRIFEEVSAKDTTPR